MKQLKHDLCLKEIDNIKDIVSKKPELKQSHSILADILELEGQNCIYMKTNDNFDHYFLDAIKMREKQLGAYNLANAIALANYSKYLIISGDLGEGANMLDQSL